MLSCVFSCITLIYMNVSINEWLGVSLGHLKSQDLLKMEMVSIKFEKEKLLVVALVTRHHITYHIEDIRGNNH